MPFLIVLKFIFYGELKRKGRSPAIPDWSSDIFPCETPVEYALFALVPIQVKAGFVPRF